jgi:hypothetical protein
MSTARFDFGQLRAFQSRTVEHQFTLYLADGATPAALASGDTVRFKVWDVADAVVLDVNSAGALAGGSIVTVDVLGTAGVTPAEVTVKLAQADVAGIAAKTYQCELAQVDDSGTSPDDPIIPIGRGTLKVETSAGGDVGLT